MKQNPTDYRNRIKALEYVDAADLTPLEGGKILFDFCRFLLPGILSELVIKPVKRHLVSLSVVATGIPMTERNDVSAVGSASFTERNPMVSGNTKPIPLCRSTYCATPAPMVKASLPICRRKVPQRVFQAYPSGTITKSNRDSVFVSVGFSGGRPFFMMLGVGLSVLLVTLLTVRPLIFTVPYSQAFPVGLSVLDGIRQPVLALALVSFGILGAVFLMMGVVRPVLLLLDQLREFFATFPHVFPSTGAFAFSTDAPPPKCLFRQVPLALCTSLHVLSLQDAE